MPHNVTLQSSGFTYTCKHNETILQAATRQGYRMQRACDAGTCQLCEGRLLQGSIQIKGQPNIIKATEHDNPKIFCCLAIPLQDIHIEVENVLPPGQLPAHIVSAQIISIDQVSADVKIIQLRLPAGKKVEFYGGQYLEIHLPDEKVATFSIASAPRQDRTLELHIRANPDSDSYPALQSQLKQGGTLKLHLPKGETTRHKFENAQEIIFIAASTGYSQVQAMVEELISLGDLRPIRIYWGARQQEDLYLHDKVQQLASEHDHIRYIPVVSEQAAWPGRKGFVHKAALEDIKVFDGLSFMCGGSPAMVYAVFDDLVEAGANPNDIVSDVFDYAPR